MQCPKCTETIGEEAIDVLESGIVIGFEVSFTCPGCGRGFACILTPGSFLEAPALAVAAGRDTLPVIEPT